MTSKTYPLANPAAMATKIFEAGGPHINPALSVGQTISRGVTLCWAVADGQITVSIVSKPFYVPESTIWEHVDAIFG